VEATKSTPLQVNLGLDGGKGPGQIISKKGMPGRDGNVLEAYLYICVEKQGRETETKSLGVGEWGRKR